MKFPKGSLKLKTLLAFLCLASISLITAVFSVWRMEALEERLEAVNMQYIPFLRVLGQLENHQMLFEYDVNRALLEKRSQLSEHHANLIGKKIDTLSRSFSRGGKRENRELEKKLSELQSQFENFLLSSKALLYGEINKDIKEEFSQNRASFKSNLRNQIKNYDRKIRNLSLSVQRDISKTLISVIILFTIFLLFMLLLLFWVERMFQPLQNLTKLMQAVAKRGLKKEDSSVLQNFIKGKDEISVFSQEFNRMASSLLGRTEQIEKQKEKLERAHNKMKKQNEELRRTKTSLAHQEKLGLIGKLSAQMAHEIRNPLNAISLHLEGLEFELDSIKPKDPELLDSLQAMKKEIKRLSSITHSYLELAKKPQLNFSPTDINALLKESLTVYGSLLKDRKIELNMELEEGIPPILLDEKSINVVIGNLIKNSCEALEKEIKDNENRKISISSRLNKKDSTVELIFSDTGMGIPPEERDSIFSPFFTTKSHGTGLGLSHSKQIIDEHAGEIFFCSTANFGTSFYLHLPLREAII